MPGLGTDVALIQHMTNGVVQNVKSKRIIWAVNPFVDEVGLIKRTAQALFLLASEWDAEVEPVYILSDVPPNVRLLPLLIHDVQQQAHEELKNILKGTKSERLQEVRLLVSASSQLRDQAQVLITYARDRGASVIGVATRARKGPKRWIMGSFTETLMHDSPVPLYVVNPLHTVPRKIKHIFFPTDFSDASRAAFEQVLTMAADIGSKVTLFHKVSNVYSPTYDVGYGGYPAYSLYYEELVSDKMAEAEKWAKSAAERGVAVKPLVDFRTDKSTAEAIVSRSKSGGGLIAMAGHTGFRGVNLLGGITRQVVRTAESPVWVIHPEPAAVAKQKRG